MQYFKKDMKKNISSSRISDCPGGQPPETLNLPPANSTREGQVGNCLFLTLTKYVLKCTYKCSGSSSCVAILCAYDERRLRCKSRDTCPDIPMWLKNGVSSHSYIGHCLNKSTGTALDQSFLIPMWQQPQTINKKPSPINLKLSILLLWNCRVIHKKRNT